MKSLPEAIVFCERNR